jgi:hypothetical protein
MLPFSVRQRSPWRDSPNLIKHWTKPDDLMELVGQIAVSLAAAHVRGSLDDEIGSDNKFTKVLSDWFGTNDVEESHQRVNQWVNAIVTLSLSYQEQIQIDYECFNDFVTSVLSEEEDEDVKKDNNNNA